MKSEEDYNIWKGQKNQIEVGRNFKEGVMSKIYQYEQKKSKHLFDVQRLVEFITVNPLARAGLVAAGAVAGFVRLVFVVYMFLRT